jgi:hypothetical protein
MQMMLLPSKREAEHTGTLKFLTGRCVFVAQALHASISKTK